MKHGPTTACGVCALMLSGCGTHKAITETPVYPDVSPAVMTGSADTLSLDPSVVEPMYTEMLAIDLPNVVRVAVAQNIDIRQAKLEVEAARGRYDASIGRALPVLAPTAIFDVGNGAARNTRGNIVDASFDSIRAFLFIDWVINPGQVAYDIIASRKRLAATEHQERAVIVDTLHTAVVQYYDLILAQSRVETARQALAEADELLRINHLRERTGTGVRADTLRAEAHLAERQQDLTIAMNTFYRASVDLSVTLRLDSTVTLVPSITELGMITLVRDELGIDELLDLAVTYRPDLEGFRSMVEAVTADRKGVAWGGFGPQFQAGYLIGGISGHNSSGLPTLTGTNREERFVASAGFRLSADTFGNLRAANAVEEQTILEGERMVDHARAQVVTALQGSRANAQLVAKAKQQVTAATEALRLTQANLSVGMMTTLDVLTAQDSLSRAGLRYAHAVVGYNQAQVDLLASLGLVDGAALGVTRDVAQDVPQEPPASAG